MKPGTRNLPARATDVVQSGGEPGILIVPEQHRIDDQHNHDEAYGEHGKSKYPDGPVPFAPAFSFHDNLLHSSGILQLFKFPGAVMLVFLKRHGPGEDDGIHRECVRAKVRVKEMDRKDEPYGQQSFVTVDDHSDVDKPARENAGKVFGEPEDKA